MASEARSPSAPTPPELADLDPALGLWSSRDAAPPRRHNLIHASTRLAYLAQLGRLSEIPLDRTLASFRSAQCLDDSRDHGNFRFWFEDAGVTDRNVAFFVGLNLAGLRLAYADQFTPGQLALLDSIGRDLRRVFIHEVAEGFDVYPNKYLGDLVCSWLLCAWLAVPPQPGLEQATRNSAARWLERGWGWGEHLSDIYAHIMLDQLGVALALLPELPAGVRSDFERLRDSLLALSAAYADGPRVPNLRAYAFDHAPRVHPFHDSIRPWKTWVDVTGERSAGADSRPTFGSLLHARGVLLRPPSTPPGELRDGGRQLRVPCERGSVAHAWIGPGVRLGGMSRYPLYSEHEHHPWGLAWQGFPVAFADSAGGWGFLRWRARTADGERAHPALDRAAPIKSLFDDPGVSPSGETETRLRGSRLLALRFFPRGPVCDELADAIELVGFAPTDLCFLELADGGRLLSFTSSGRRWTLGHHPLGAGPGPAWTTWRGHPRWDLRRPASTFPADAPLAHLWWIACGDSPPPVLTAESRDAWRVDWPSATETPWRLRLDLAASAPRISD